MTNDAISKVQAWMDGKGLNLAPHKTESVIFMKRRCNVVPALRVAVMDILPVRAVKYLGVQMDENCRMVRHVREVIIKADKTCKALARIMPRTGGTSTDKRKVHLNAMYSVVLYGAPVWQGAVEYRRYRDMLRGVQRRALIRVARAYRTVSTEALTVLVGTPPIKLLVKARAQRYREPEATGKGIMEGIMEEWQQGWNNITDKARWTRRLIRDIGKWMTIDKNEIDYYTTQAFTSSLWWRGR